jgi:hypothetical protein
VIEISSLGNHRAPANHDAEALPVKVELSSSATGHEQIERRQRGEKLGRRHAADADLKPIVEGLLHEIGLVEEKRVAVPRL